MSNEVMKVNMAMNNGCDGNNTIISNIAKNILFRDLEIWW